MTRLCDRLIRKGLITRHDAPDSRREVEIAATDEGRAVVQRVLRAPPGTGEALEAALRALEAADVDRLAVLREGGYAGVVTAGETLKLDEILEAPEEPAGSGPVAAQDPERTALRRFAGGDHELARVLVGTLVPQSDRRALMTADHGRQRQTTAVPPSGRRVSEGGGC